VSTVAGWKSDEPNAVFRNFLFGPFTRTSWNFDGDRTDEMYGLHLDGRFRSLWGFNLNVFRFDESADPRFTRGGPVVSRPGFDGVEFNFHSDQRRIYYVDGGYNFETGQPWRERNAWVGLTVRPSATLRVSVSPSYAWSFYANQYLEQEDDATASGTYGRRYVFGTLDYRQLSFDTRVDWTFSPALSLQVFAQPLVADGRYSSFQSLTRARSWDFLRHREEDGTLTEGPDGYLVRGPAAGAPDIDIGRPDFSSRALVGNAVLRWEYRPGSVLFLVWQQKREGDDGVPGFSLGRDMKGAFREPPENVFAVKLSYWLGR
jgi:hypothetical protein